MGDIKSCFTLYSTAYHCNGRIVISDGYPITPGHQIVGKLPDPIGE